MHTYIQTPYFVSYVTAYISSILLVCPAGQYRSDNDVTCQQCPGNTKTEQVAAPLCECLDGYFRNDEQRGTNIPLPDWITTLIDPNEQPRDRCTRKSHTIC